jgi:hypothetical protein
MRRRESFRVAETPFVVLTNPASVSTFRCFDRLTSLMPRASRKMENSISSTERSKPHIRSRNGV